MRHNRQCNRFAFKQAEKRIVFNLLCDWMFVFVLDSIGQQWMRERYNWMTITGRLQHQKEIKYISFDSESLSFSRLTSIRLLSSGTGQRWSKNEGHRRWMNTKEKHNWPNLLFIIWYKFGHWFSWAIHHFISHVFFPYVPRINTFFVNFRCASVHVSIDAVKWFPRISIVTPFRFRSNLEFFYIFATHLTSTSTAARVRYNNGVWTHFIFSFALSNLRVELKSFWTIFSRENERRKINWNLCEKWNETIRICSFRFNVFFPLFSSIFISFDFIYRVAAFTMASVENVLTDKSDETDRSQEFWSFLSSVTRFSADE